tara:strand:+ start:492 stop:698 length:207 start_codon:yes stop_codon:yes gene_type:complete
MNSISIHHVTDLKVHDAYTLEGCGTHTRAITVYCEDGPKIEITLFAEDNEVISADFEVLPIDTALNIS